MYRRKQLLNTEVIDGRLVISIGVEALAFAAEHCPELTDGYITFSSETYGPKITDPDEFAHDVVAALIDEAEDGTTLVHAMLDQAIVLAVESGSLAVADEWVLVSETPLLERSWPTKE
jgi:hypothetical protein